MPAKNFIFIKLVREKESKPLPELKTFPNMIAHDNLYNQTIIFNFLQSNVEYWD